MKTEIVLNPTTADLSVNGYPSFAPGEERVYDEATARHLTDGSGLVIKSQELKPAPKKKSSNPA